VFDFVAIGVFFDSSMKNYILNLAKPCFRLILLGG
jgi:hypothetical protein